MSEDMKTYLAEVCLAIGFPLQDEQLTAFDTYAALLADWNTRMNLTAITEVKEMAIKHFSDSLAILQALPIPKQAKLIDIGTGAGFPGIPLKIVRNDLELTLLDSLNKRLIFLNSLLSTLELNGTIIHARAEDAARRENLRGQFDIVTARAVADLPILCEYCLPFVRVGGFFLAMKGPALSAEMEKSGHAISLLGGEASGVYCYTLADGSTRSIFIIKKTSKTPSKYPRQGAKISKSPL